MVQIPVFTSKSSPTITAPVTSGVPNIIGPAMLPYEQISRLGNTVLAIGQNKLEQDLKFENDKAQLKYNHDLNLLQLAKDFEAEEYVTQKQHEMNVDKEMANYKTEMFKITESLSAEFEINKIKLQRENTVNTAIAQSWDEIYKLSDAANRSTNTDTALDNWDYGIQKLKDKLTNNVKDLYAKELILQKLDENTTLERAKVSSNINKNILEMNKMLFEDKVNTLKNNVIRNHTHFDVISLEELIGDNSIIHQQYKTGLLELDGKPVTPDVYIEAVKKDIFNIMAENMAQEEPQRYQFYKRQGFWDDKLTPENIDDYYEKSVTALNAERNDAISNIKNAKTIYNNNVDLFTDVASVDYFGSPKQYEKLLNEGIALQKDLLSLGLVSEAQEVEKHLRTLQDKHAVYHVVQNLKHDTIDNINEFYFKIKRGEDIFGDQRINAVLLGEVEKLKNYVNEKKDSNPIGLAEELWGMKISRLNWTETDPEKFSKDLELYQGQMGWIKEKLGLSSMAFFRPEEINQIKNALNNGSRNEILLLTNNIAAASGVYANDAFTEISAQIPSHAHLGKLLNMSKGEETQATQHLVDGIINMRDKDIATLVGKVKLDSLAYLEISEFMMGDLINNAPETGRQVKSAAKHIFTNMVANNEELRGLIIDDNVTNDALLNAYKLSVQYASGMVIDKDGAKGGIEFFNGKPIIITQNKLNGSLDDFDLGVKENNQPSLELLLENYLTDELFFQATAAIGEKTDDLGRSRPVLINKLPVRFNSKGEVVGEIKADELFKPFGGYDKIFLETNEYGQYFISFGNPGDPAHEYYKTKDLTKAVLDINRILPDLLEAWKASPGLINDSELFDDAGFRRDEILE